MIKVKNLELNIGEDKTMQFSDGGEMEQFIALNIKAFLARDFGIVCDVETK